MRALNSQRRLLVSHIFIPIIVFFTLTGCHGVKSSVISDDQVIDKFQVNDEAIQQTHDIKDQPEVHQPDGKSSDSEEHIDIIQLTKEEGIRRFDAEVESDVDNLKYDDKIIRDQDHPEYSKDPDLYNQKRSVKRKLEPTIAEEEKINDPVVDVEKTVEKGDNDNADDKQLLKSVDEITDQNTPELIPVKVDQISDNIFLIDNEAARKSLMIDNEDEENDEVRNERSSEKEDNKKTLDSHNSVQYWREQALDLQKKLKNQTYLQYLREQAEILPGVPKYTENQYLDLLKKISPKKSLEKFHVDSLDTSLLNKNQIEVLRYAEGLLVEKQRQSFAENVFECIRGFNIFNCMRIFIWPIIVENLPERITQNLPSLPIEVTLSDWLPGSQETQKITRAASVHQQRLISPELVISNILKEALESNLNDNNLPSYINAHNETLLKLLNSNQFEILEMAEKFLPESARQDYSSKMTSCIKRFEYFSCVKYFAWPMIKQHFPALPEFPDYQSWYPTTISVYPGYPIIPFPEFSEENGKLPEIIEADIYRDRSPRPETFFAHILKNTLDQQPRQPFLSSAIRLQDDMEDITPEQLSSIQMAEQLLPVDQRPEFVKSTVKCMKQYDYLTCMRYSTWPTVRKWKPQLPNLSDFESFFSTFTLPTIPTFSPPHLPSWFPGAGIIGGSGSESGSGSITIGGGSGGGSAPGGSGSLSGSGTGTGAGGGTGSGSGSGSGVQVIGGGIPGGQGGVQGGTQGSGSGAGGGSNNGGITIIIPPPQGGGGVQGGSSGGGQWSGSGSGAGSGGNQGGSQGGIQWGGSGGSQGGNQGGSQGGNQGGIQWGGTGSGGSQGGNQGGNQGSNQGGIQWGGSGGNQGGSQGGTPGGIGGGIHWGGVGGQGGNQGGIGGGIQWGGSGSGSGGPQGGNQGGIQWGGSGTGSGGSQGGSQGGNQGGIQWGGSGTGSGGSQGGSQGGNQGGLQWGGSGSGNNQGGNQGGSQGGIQWGGSGTGSGGSQGGNQGGLQWGGSGSGGIQGGGQGGNQGGLQGGSQGGNQGGIQGGSQGGNQGGIQWGGTGSGGSQGSNQGGNQGGIQWGGSGGNQGGGQAGNQGGNPGGIQWGGSGSGGNQGGTQGGLQGGNQGGIQWGGSGSGGNQGGTQGGPQGGNQGGIQWGGSGSNQGGSSVTQKPTTGSGTGQGSGSTSGQGSGSSNGNGGSSITIIIHPGGSTHVSGDGTGQSTGSSGGNLGGSTSNQGSAGNVLNDGTGTSGHGGTGGIQIGGGGSTSGGQGSNIGSTGNNQGLGNGGINSNQGAGGIQIGGSGTGGQGGNIGGTGTNQGLGGGPTGGGQGSSNTQGSSGGIQIGGSQTGNTGSAGGGQGPSGGSIGGGIIGGGGLGGNTDGGLGGSTGGSSGSNNSGGTGGIQIGGSDTGSIGGSGSNQGPIGGSGSNQGPIGGTGSNQGPIGGSGSNQGSIGGTGSNQGPIGGSGSNQGSIGGSGSNQGSIGGTGSNLGPIAGTPGSGGINIIGGGAPGGSIGGSSDTSSQCTCCPKSIAETRESIANLKQFEPYIINLLNNLRFSLINTPIQRPLLSDKQSLFQSRLNNDELTILGLAESLTPLSARRDVVSRALGCVQGGAEFMVCTKNVIWPFLKLYITNFPEFPNEQAVLTLSNGRYRVSNRQQIFNHPFTSTSANFENLYRYPNIQISARTPIHSRISAKADDVPVISVTGNRFVPIYSDHPEGLILNILSTISKTMKPLDGSEFSSKISEFISRFNSTLNEQQENILKIAESLLPESNRQSLYESMLECLGINDFITCSRDVLWPKLSEYFSRLPNFPTFQRVENVNFEDIQPISDNLTPISETDVKTDQHGNAMVTITDTRFVPILSDHPEELILKVLKNVDPLQQSSSPHSAIAKSSQFTSFTNQQADVILVAENLLPSPLRENFVTQMNSCARDSNFVDCMRDVAWPTVSQYVPKLPSFPNVGSLPSLPMSKLQPSPLLPPHLEPTYTEHPAGQFGFLPVGQYQAPQYFQPYHRNQQFSGVHQHDNLQTGIPSSVESVSTVPEFAGQPTEILLDLSQDKVILSKSLQSDRYKRSTYDFLFDDYPESINAKNLTDTFHLNWTESDFYQYLANISDSISEESLNDTEYSSVKFEESMLDSLNSSVKESLTKEQIKILKMVERIGIQSTRGMIGNVISCITSLSFLRCLGIFIFPLIAGAMPSLPGLPGLPGLPFGRSYDDGVQDIFNMSPMDVEKELLRQKESVQQTMEDWYESLIKDKFESNYGFLNFEGYGNGEIGIKFTNPRKSRGVRIKDNKNLPSILTIISDIMEDVLDPRSDHDKSKRKKEKNIRFPSHQVLEESQDVQNAHHTHSHDDKIINMFLDKLRTNETHEDDNDEDDGQRYVTLNDAYKAFQVLFGAEMGSEVLKNDKSSYQDNTKSEKDDIEKINKKQKNKSTLIIQLPRLNDNVELARKLSNSLVSLSRGTKNNMQMMPGIGLGLTLLLQVALSHARIAASVANVISNMAMGAAMFTMMRQTFFNSNSQPKVQHIYETESGSAGPWA